jgi:hypothetical protein
MRFGSTAGYLHWNGLEEVNFEESVGTGGLGVKRALEPTGRLAEQRLHPRRGHLHPTFASAARAA